MNKVTYIPNELASAVKGGFVTNTKEIIDKILDTSQEEVNKLIIKAGEDILHLSQIIEQLLEDMVKKEEVYTKEQADSRFQEIGDYATNDSVNQKYSEHSQQIQEIQQQLNQLQQIQSQLTQLQQLTTQLQQTSTQLQQGQSQLQQGQNQLQEGQSQLQQGQSQLQQEYTQLQQQTNQLLSNQQKHVILRQSQYDNLENYERNVIYIILEDIPYWGFGDNFPITLSGEWIFGDNLPIILA